MSDPDQLRAMAEEVGLDDFKPFHHYREASDCFYVRWADVPAFQRRISDGITLRISAKTGEVVGVIVRGARFGEVGK